MDDINIDIDEIKSKEPYYLTKSVKLYKLNGRLLLFAILISAFVKPIFKSLAGIFDLLVGLPVLAVIIIAPFGLFYSWKTYKEGEGTAKMRRKYLLIHIAFNILTLLFISSLIKGLSELLNQK